ncbi:RING-H2 finger protein ATL22-like [Durio zibethinus]|uniref:RING-type E3 ubiquitin transferase n=1 Tax=Durio zibethinus TaxID=66656 RepID=A0A6P5YBC5_DURZI|nr:RING-H2 finger protein ATL22-like [Durio zibethinus]
MNTSSFFLLLLSLVLSISEAFEASCPPAKCGHGGFVIKFPFRLKTHQPLQCGDGDQGFDLFCRNNSTVIHFPSYGDLVVESISYDTMKLNLLDPKNCVHEVFLNLNLSLTPFHYYFVLKNYTYFNCSVSLGPSVAEIPCLSGSQHHVYTVESPVRVPDSCRIIKTVAIPFAYSSYLSDSSFGLGLTWELPEPVDSSFHSKAGWSHLAQKKVLMIGGIVLLAAAAVLMSVKILRAKIVDSHGEKENQFTEELIAAQHKSPMHQSC